MSFKRAFTKDGKSLTSVRDKYGVLDHAGKWALAIRFTVFIPVIIAVIGLLLASFTEITFEQYIEALKQVKQVFGW